MKKQWSYILAAVIGFGAILMLGDSQKKTVNEPKTEIKAEQRDDCERLSQMLSQVKGAGEVRVIAAYPSSNEKMPSYDVKEETNKNEQNGIRAELSTVDKQLSGNSPFILAELYPKPTGVIILAQGADNVEIKAQLIRAAMAFFDIEMNKIEVMTMK